MIFMTAIDALKWRNTKHKIINEESSKWLINPFPLSIIVHWEALYDTLLSFKILYNFTDLKIYSPNLYVLTLLTIIVTLTFLESVTSLHNSTLSLSPCSQDHRKECVGLWSRADGDFRTERAYWGQESTLGTDCLYWALCTAYCAVCNAPHCTVMHCTRRNTDATRGQLLIWFRGLLGDYIGIFCKDQ